jgi:signal transduction histidine kinase
MSQVMESGPAGEIRLSRADRARITTRYRDLLRRDGSPLLMVERIRNQLVEQLGDVLDAVVGHLQGDGDPEVAPPIPQGVPADLSLQIGAERASAGVHPVHSLHAASLIYEAALPVVAERLAAAGHPSAELAAGLALNRAIMDRMMAASSTYVDYLLTKVHSSNRDERRRLARELHDMAAPAVAVGLQNIDLYGIYALTDQLKAASHLATARSSLLDALSIIRDLSAQTREAVGNSGLPEAISRYAETLPPSITVEIGATGDLSGLHAAHREEVFLIVREAIRNAVNHASPQLINVSITAGDHLVAEVVDDGTGFDVESMLTDDNSSVGLNSMRERAELLGGTTVITSRIDHGSRVWLSVPIHDERIHGTTARVAETQQGPGAAAPDDSALLR